MMMFGRFRLLAAALALGFSLGVAYAGASAAASGRITARLTSKSFTAAQVGSVKVRYKFSSKSSRFAYVLSRKQRAKWSTVRTVSKRGSFRGSHTMTVKSVFGSKPITAGQYRLRLSSSANSVTLSFTITPPKPPPLGSVKPKAGSWVATSLSGPVSGRGGSTNPNDSVTASSISFTVAPDGATVIGFAFAYTYSGPGTALGTTCSGSSSTADQTPAPITNGRFATPAQNTWSNPMSYGTFSGTFDSPTTAHGTAWLRGYLGAFDCQFPGYANTGTFSWTATWQP